VKPRALPAAELEFVAATLERIVPGVREFRNERILLTGGTGFFGKWLTQTLLRLNDRWRLGNRLVLVTRDRARALEGSPWLASRDDVEWIESDVRKLPPAGSFTSVIHGATTAAFQAEDEAELLQTIVDGTLRVLAASGGASHFLFLSSGAVYGPQPPAIERLDENFPPGKFPGGSRAAYAEGKLEAEKLCLDFFRGNGQANVSVARCFAVIGAYLPFGAQFAAGNFIANALEGKPISLAGDGTPLRSFLYAADLTVWLLALLLRGQGAYNVGSDAAIPIADVARAVSSVARERSPERPCPVEIAKKPDPTMVPDRYVPSIARARAELGLEVWTPFPDAVRRTFEACAREAI
jgi:nucleoside-diphosphate-sugar epimerase